MRAAFVLVALFSLCHAAFNIPCGYYLDDGVSFVSLASIAGKSYYFSNQAPSNVPSELLPTQVGNITFELAVCGAVQTQNAALCTSTNSAANWIVNGTCLSAGEANVAGWESALTGINLVYYHGVNLTHTNDLSTRIAFECGEDTNMTYMWYNAQLSTFGFTITTKAVCIENAVQAPNATNITTVPCTTMFRGESIDLSPLIHPNGSYVFYNTTDGIDYEVQICGTVKTNWPAACTTPSAANAYNRTSGECTPVGDIRAYAFEPNPSNAGVGLILYHGAPSNGGTIQTRIYFECFPIYIPDEHSPPLPPNQLVYEHFNPMSGNGGSYHLIMGTNYTCPPSVLATTTTTTATGIASTSTSSSSSSSTSTTTSASTSPASLVVPSVFMFAGAIASFLF